MTQNEPPAQHSEGTFPFAFPDYVASQKILREEWIVDTKTGIIYYPSGKKIPTSKNNSGYLMINTTFESIKLPVLVHRAVMIARRRGRTIPRILTINHINEIKTDNRAENLELKTMAENNRLHYLTGRPKPGSPYHPVGEEGVLRIRRECKNLDRKAHAQKIKEFAKEYDLSRGAVCAIARGASYAGIIDPEETAP